MQKEDFIAVGIVLKPHGLRGHVVFKFYDEKMKIGDIEHLFIKSHETYLPYFIEEIKDLPKGYRIKLEEINDLESAQNLVNSEFFLKQSEIDKLKNEEENSSVRLKGFKVFRDSNDNYLGIISDVLENRYQDVLEIAHSSERKILIPYVDVFIKKINLKEKYIILNVPDGLIELYIEDKNTFDQP